MLATSITALIEVNRPIKGCGGADKLQRGLAGVCEGLGIHENTWLPAAETWIDGAGTWDSRCLGVESMVASLNGH